MSMKLLIIGSDKISKKCVLYLNQHGVDFNRVYTIVDRSTNIRRVFNLLMNGRISLQSLFKMVMADFVRKNYPKFNFRSKIHTNDELEDILNDIQCNSVYLFRAGLIINKKVLSQGVRFFNVHCASIPEYAGLCSIYRAIKDGVYLQKACMHVVTMTIDDSSEVVDYEPYELDPMKSYYFNEEMAYDAGIKLLARALLK
jgi:methionyl-tRNA formyltransferase